jgi:hypothetical protein
MEHSPSWEANRSSVSQLIRHMLWSPKAHHRIPNSPPHVHILNQINPVPHRTSYFENATTDDQTTAIQFDWGTLSLNFWQLKADKYIWPNILSIDDTNMVPYDRPQTFSPSSYLFFKDSPIHIWGTRWRSWLRHCARSQNVVGSLPDGVTGIFQWLNPSGRILALGSTQPLTETSTRNSSWG